MIEGYTTEEVVECCQEYLLVQRGIGIPDSRHKGRLSGKGISGRKTLIDYEYKDVSQAHYCVLQSTKLMKPYVDEHMALIMEERNGRSDGWVMKQHRSRLTTWLKDRDIPPGESEDSITISTLARGPSKHVTSWNAYDINGYTYYTHTKDSKSANQNSGVRVDALDGRGRKVPFFGVIEDIWELDYGRNIKMALFRCRWIKQFELNEIGLRVVDLQNIGYEDDPWVLASSVAQVLYIPDPASNLPPKKKTKHVVASGKQHIIGVDGVEDVSAYNDYAEMPLFTDFINKINAVEKNLPKEILPWERTGGKGKVV
jgi:hypothetical protein